MSSSSFDSTWLKRSFHLFTLINRIAVYNLGVQGQNILGEVRVNENRLVTQSFAVRFAGIEWNYSLYLWYIL